jgi:hypothetical protein
MRPEDNTTNHRDHHVSPRDVDGTLLPPQVIVGSMPIAAGLWLAVFGPRRAAVTAMVIYVTVQRW